MKEDACLNPNNCETCDYKHIEHSTGHCYMFHEAPTEECHQHTERAIRIKFESPFVLAWRMVKKEIAGEVGTSGNPWKQKE